MTAPSLVPLFQQPLPPPRAGGVCHIIGGGDPAPRRLALLFRPGDFLIAADSGYDTLRKDGVSPHLTVGDFDSAKTPLRDVSGERVCLPVEKDDTDLSAAVKIALAKGYRTFFLYAALGGKRFSHSLANLQLLALVRDEGGRGFLLQEDTTAVFLENETMVFSLQGAANESETPFAGGQNCNRPGVSLSLLLHSDTAIISEEGLAYSLHRVCLTNRFPLGVSNAFTGKQAKVTVEHGSAFLIIEEPS